MSVNDRPKRTQFATVVSVFGLGVVLAVAGSFAAEANSSSDPRDVALKVLSNERAAADRLPALLESGDFPMEEYDLNSARLLGKGTLGDYWVLLKDGGQVCFVADLPDDVGGIGCRPIAEFNKSGNVLRVVSTKYAVDLVVAPDGYAAQGDAGEVAPGVYEISPKKSDHAANMAAGRGKTFELRNSKGQAMKVERPAATDLVDPNE